MYEQAELPVFRRILWIALWFIVIVAVVWTLVWLIFFRHSTPVATTNQQTHHSQSTTTKTSPSTGSTKSTGTTSKSGTAASSGTTSQTPTSNSGTTQPNNLTNAGAGDIFIPFGVAVMVGSSFYYIRLHKKLMR